jgi:hypothetical protein
MRDDKLKQFMRDPALNQAVRAFLLDIFIKPRKDKDVHTLAASRIALDQLQEAWTELEKFKVAEQKEEKLSNPGYL